ACHSRAALCLRLGARYRRRRGLRFLLLRRRRPRMGCIRGAAELARARRAATFRRLPAGPSGFRRPPAPCHQHHHYPRRQFGPCPVLRDCRPAPGRWPPPALCDGLVRGRIALRARGLAALAPGDPGLVGPGAGKLRRAKRGAGRPVDAPAAAAAAISTGRIASCASPPPTLLEYRSRRPAIDDKALPGDVIGLLAAEHCHHVAHIVAIAEAFRRDAPLAREFGDLLLIGDALGGSPFVELLFHEGAVVHAGKEVVDDHIVP